MDVHDLEIYKAMGARPRVHNNGFIQIDLNENDRLHIWGHPDIPRQKVASPIHDHIFGFVSKVLVGRMVNLNYGIIPRVTGEFRVYEPSVRIKEDTVLGATDTTVSLIPLSFGSYSKGDTYGILKYAFHETFVAEPTVTLIHKVGKTQAQGNVTKVPRVLVPVDKQPDNEFDRYGYDEDMLWRIAEEVLGIS